MDLTSASAEGLQLSIGRTDPIGGRRTETDGSVTKVDFVVHQMELKNVGSIPITLPVLPLSKEPASPRQTSRGPAGEASEEYLYAFDLPLAFDGATLISPDLFVTLRPGESASLPFFAGVANRGARLPRFQVTYSVSKAYAERHGCWAGTLTVIQRPAFPNEKPRAANKSPEPAPLPVPGPAGQEPRRP
jgi:hypothetical protein